MSTTDESPDDTGDATPSIDEIAGEPVIRRSTYAPPAVVLPMAEDAALGLHDDDELANALAEELSRATGVVPVIYSLDDVPVDPEPLFFPAPDAPDAPVAAGAAAEAAPDMAPAPVPEPVSAPVPEREPEPDPEHDAPRAPDADAREAMPPPSAADFSASAYGSAPPPASDATPVMQPPAFATSFDDSPPPPSRPPADQPGVPGVEPHVATFTFESPVFAPPAPTAPDAAVPGTPAFEFPVFEFPVANEPKVFEIPVTDEVWGPADPAPPVFDLSFSEAPDVEPARDEHQVSPVTQPDESFEARQFEAPQFEEPQPAAPLPPAPEPRVAQAPVESAADLTLEQQISALAQQPSPMGRPWVPERRSLPDDQLFEVLDATGRPGSSLEMMQQLENQLALREQEAREYLEWEATMLSVGSPEAVEAVQQVRQQFTGIVPPQSALDTTPVAQTAPARVTAETPDEPAGVPVAEPEPETALFVPPALIEPPPASPSILPEPDLVSQFWATAVESPNDFTKAPVDAESAAEPILPSLVDPVLPVDEQPPAVGWATGTPPTADRSRAPLDFDNLLSGDTPPAPAEPHPFADTHTGSIATGSVSIVQPLEQEFADDVDETDRAFDGVFVAGAAVGAAAMTAPVEPVLAPRIPDQAVVIDPDAPAAPPVFRVEQTGTEPTPVDQRVGRAARLFWLWFAPNSSIISVAFGATLFALGMSLRQAVVAALAGVALSFIPLGLGTLAGKRSGQPTMIVSRAAFGVAGNIVPAVLAVITRLFWGAVLLWVLAAATASILVSARVTGGLGVEQLVIIGLGVGFVLALLIAFFGYELLARFSLVVSILSIVLLVGVVVLTLPRVDIAVALSNPDGPWTLVLTGAVLVFSFVGLVWANSSADLARYQRPGSSGGGSMLLATFGTTLPTFLLIAYGSVLAASSPALADGLVDDPLRTLGSMLPLWYPVPLIAATALSLLSGVVLSLYSAGFALQAVGVRLARPWSTLIAGLLLFALAWVLSILVADLTLLFRDVATTLAVPVAAWAGIFAADTMIRNRRYHAPSLLASGGVYPRVHWVNLSALFAITVIGFGFTSATVSWLSWQGFGFTILGFPLDGDLAGADLGVLVALLLGLLIPIVAGVPGIRRQEAADAD